MRLARFLLVFLPLGLGCDSTSQPELPPLYPVTGTIVASSGKKITEGELNFSSQTDPALTITGSVGSEGTFELKSINASRVEQGAPAGEYRVTYIRPIDGGADVEVVHLPKPVVIESKENTLKLVLPKRSGSR